jgi:predicted exporter
MSLPATTAARWRALLWLLLVVSAGLILLSQLNHSQRLPLQTDLMALLPATEKNPLAELAVNRLANSTGNRVVLLVGHASARNAQAAAQALADDLRRSGAFGVVNGKVAPINLRAMASFYLDNRFVLLSDADRTALAAGKPELAARLLHKLHSPLRFGLPLAEDPFGFTDAWLAGLPLNNVRLQQHDGWLQVQEGEAGKTWVLISAELSGSAYDGAVQTKAVAAIKDAESALAGAATVLRAGTLFYAEAGRRDAEREFDLIGAGSLAGMLLLLWFVFRSPRPLVLGLLSVGFGVLTGTVTVLWLHGEMHVVTLVFGAALIGEAIDYSIQYFAAHLGAGQQWEPIAGLKRIAPGLVVALATSLLAYCALLLAPFPGLSQIALFALAGLSAAWLTVFLLLPAVLVRPTRRDPQLAVAMPQRLLRWWQQRVSRRHCILAAGLLLLLATPGWLKLQSNDDIRLLVARPAGLVAQEEKVRDLVGIGNSSQFILIEGRDSNEVLTRAEALAPRLDRLVAAGEMAGYQSLAAFVPSRQRQQENRQLWKEQVYGDREGFTRILAQQDLVDAIGRQQLSAFGQQAGRLITLDDWLRTPLAVPLHHLWLGESGGISAAVILPRDLRSSAALAAAAEGLTGVSVVDKASSVSRLFRSWRQWGAAWLAGAALLVYGVLCVRYRPRQAAVMLAPTLLAMALSLAVFGYVGAPFTLFNLMALMLVLGVGVNYAVFLQENDVHAAASLAGVLLSAGTTLLSFGLLAFSSMPALAGFGLTLLTGIGLAVLFCPAVLCFRGSKPA